MYYLADYLQDHCYNVYVVHSQNAEYYGNYGNTIRFHSIPVGSPNMPISSENNLESEGEKNESYLKKKMIGSAKHIFYKSNIISLEKGIFNEPNCGMGVAGYRFIRNAREQILNTISEKGIKNIIISGPPFSLFCLVQQIKKRFPEVNIIMDYRDPWNTPHLSYPISKHIEQNALKHADKVVFLNERMLLDASSKFNLSKEKCEVVLNGYSKQNWDKVLKNAKNRGTVSGQTYSDRMIIGYIGGISFDNRGYRNISSFLDAYDIFQENKNVLLRFVGAETSQKIEDIKNHFPGTLEVLPPVDTQTSLQYMLECDVLFLIHTDTKTSRYVLTGKFFDYIRSGKVIFGVAGSDNTYFLELIRKHHLGIGCLSQSTHILDSLELLYKKWEDGTLEELRNDKGLDLDSLSRNAQNSRYLELLGDLEPTYSMELVT
ncbi:glycosyltransferase family protein [Methanogenium organophilum]|uniref:Uncharacterized protein n=1 Tax=Methanogenium organophilum TaxID=2199 RepID=A0A9X9S3E0_METOG|nr:hypothetical protein [Methanogenium organophilum]WAI01174.1 hypothetical protein OU421_12280 [Methanogenium organophilum]